MLSMSSVQNGLVVVLFLSLLLLVPAALILDSSSLCSSSSSSSPFFCHDSHHADGEGNNIYGDTDGGVSLAAPLQECRPMALCHPTSGF